MLSKCFLAIALSIDALGMGIAYGLRRVSLSAGSRLVVSLQALCISFFSLFLGQKAADILPPAFSTGIGAGLLFLLGGWLIYQGARGQEEQTAPLKEGAVVKHTVAVLRNPEACDTDASKRIDVKEAFALGFALSVDSFGAGFGSGVAGLFTPLLPFLIALCQLIFLSGGLFLGKKIQGLADLSDSTWVISSGILLLLLGILRLL